MRFIPVTILFGLILFLGGCWHGMGQVVEPPPPVGSDSPKQSTTTIDNSGTQYLPETSIEGKTELRFTKEGKKIYNNPELGLYFEYPEDFLLREDDLAQSIREGIYIISLRHKDKNIPRVVFTNTVTDSIAITLTKQNFDVDGGRSRVYLSGGKMDFNGDIVEQ